MTRDDKGYQGGDRGWFIPLRSNSKVRVEDPILVKLVKNADLWYYSLGKSNAIRIIRESVHFSLLVALTHSVLYT